MGAVYKARQPSLDRVVALKILPIESAGDAGFAERFNREARALAKLSHPNIVGVYDFGQTHGLHYFVMEYVDGSNLRQIEQTGKLAPHQALQIIPQICEALQFAHDEGVVHRDIKPENVLLDKKGRVKIADFGLAKILNLEAKDFRLTGARDVMGTPHYMAPEQVENPQQVDHRADIYSLGVVFYEMLTGELPLGRFAPPSRKVQVDVRLDEVVLHALEKEPQRRYQQASEIKTDVEHIVTAPEPVQSPPAVVPAVTPPRRELWKTAVSILAITLTVLLVGSVILGVVLFSFSGPKNKPSAAATPNLVVAGTVTNLAADQPVTGVRRADSFASIPPVVIKTNPESGSTDVDPDLKEISVTFSKPMKDSNWSWVKCGEENFPEKTGEIHYLQDGRTCVVPVKLNPGKLYATWLNRDEFQDFQDIDGRPAIPYLLIFETKKKN